MKLNIKAVHPTIALCALVVLPLLSSCQSASAEEYLVKNGQPQAEIVVAEDMPPVNKLAVQQLQTYIKLISGATLPIVHQRTDKMPNAIYVGATAFTKQHEITAKNLPHGGFHMKSGDHWLALLGDDTQFNADAIPLLPRRSLSEQGYQELYTKWHQLTGLKYGDYPGVYKGMYKFYNKQLNLWAMDKHGSFNATTQFLRDLGVRWYMPGELGQIVPTQRTIVLPQMDKTVRPAFPLRRFRLLARFGQEKTKDNTDLLWYMRMGLNMGQDVIGPAGIAHGMRPLVYDPKLQKDHPEYFAIWNGKRRNTGGAHDKVRAKPNLCSDGLIQLNVNYVRAMFDAFPTPMASVMPVDGFTRAGEQCVGAATPERGGRGVLSNYVWGYVNKVAKAVYKEYPNRKITCEAYSTFTLPPDNIEQLSPNVVVSMNRGIGQVVFSDPKLRSERIALLEKWAAKTSSGMVFRQKYFSKYLPKYVPHAIADGLKFAQKIKASGIIGVTWAHGNTMPDPGYRHLNLYFNSRLLWDPNLDVEKMLDEYCRLYYGPAAKQMRAFIDYSENHWNQIDGTIPPAEKMPAVNTINQIFELLHTAQQAVEPESKYGQRIAFVAKYLQTLGHKRDQLAQERKNVPYARFEKHSGVGVTLDGQLTEPVWGQLRAYPLRDIKTGHKDAIGTSFRLFWDRSDDHPALYVGIRCEDPDMKNLDITTTQDGDRKIFMGDRIEMYIETQVNSFYQIAVNPAGALVDLNWAGGDMDWKWSSQAEVATHIGQDAWIVEMRLPVTGSTQIIDPLHLISGKMPERKRALPWFFNICRERHRNGHKTAYAFSPTGGKAFRDVAFFAKLTN